MSRIVGIRFHAVGKVYHFKSDDSTIAVGDHVIVDTAQGREMGKVVQVFPPGTIPASKQKRKYKSIRKQATTEDMVRRESLRQQEPEIKKTATSLAREMKLPVKIVKAEYKYNGSQVRIYYEGEKVGNLGRFRSKLANIFHTKVSLQSVGPRDAAKFMGGCGACGLAQRCCSAFLVEFSPISIRMAKAQGLPLVPAEIAGMCGRLRCCLAYEYEFYKDAGKGMPKLGKQVKTIHGAGKVVERNLLKGTITLATEDGRVVVQAEDLWVKKEDSSPPPIAGGCGNCPRREATTE